MQEEKQRELSYNSSPLAADSSTLAASVFPRSSTGPQRKSPNPKGRPTYFCDYCKTPGHSISHCFKLNGYPKDKGHKPPAAPKKPPLPPDASAANSTVLTKDQYDQLLALLSATNTDHKDSTDSKTMMAGKSSSFLLHASKSSWIIDCGSTHHTCPHLDYFDSYKSFTESGNITMPNNFLLLLICSSLSSLGSVKPNQ